MSYKDLSNKFKFDIPNYKINIPKVKLPEIEMPEPEPFKLPTVNEITPRLDFLSTKPKPPKYEDTYFKQMADDIKTPLEQQLNSVKSIADSAQRQANSTEAQLLVMQEQLDLAKREASSTNKEALKSRRIALIAILVSMASVIVDIITGISHF